MKYTIKSLPEEERPREKLEKYGAESLSDSELLAIVLRTGVKGKNAIELAREIIKKFGSVRNLKEVHLQELLEVKGLGKAKALTLMAVVELSRRISSTSGSKVSSPEEAVSVIERFRDRKFETFGLITLDASGKVINVHEVFKGSFDFAVVTPRQVLTPAVKDLAKYIILFHNHPADNPKPSREDIDSTMKIVETARLLEIEVLDHIILSPSGYFSFKEGGIL